MEFGNYTNSDALIKRLQMKGLLDEKNKETQEQPAEEDKEITTPKPMRSENNIGSLEALDYQSLLNSTLVQNMKVNNGKTQTITFKSSGQNIKINGEDVKVQGTGTFEITTEGNNVIIKAASKNASSITFNNTKDLNITVEKSDKFPNASFNIKTGTGNDTIFIKEGGKVKTINSKGGDNVIINAGNADSIQGGDNDDTILNFGSVKQIKGNKGNDAIFNKGKVTGNIAGDAGDDIIQNDGSVTQNIYGYAGNDEFINNGTAKNIDGGAGNDFIQNNGKATGNVLGGSGNDKIINQGNAKKVDGGAGNDTIINLNNVIFENTKKNFTLKENETALINADGSVSVTTGNISTVYDKAGNLSSYAVNGEPAVKSERNTYSVINEDKSLFKIYLHDGTLSELIVFGGKDNSWQISLSSLKEQFNNKEISLDTLNKAAELLTNGDTEGITKMKDDGLISEKSTNEMIKLYIDLLNSTIINGESASINSDGTFTHTDGTAYGFINKNYSADKKLDNIVITINDNSFVLDSQSETVKNFNTSKMSIDELNTLLNKISDFDIENIMEMCASIGINDLKDLTKYYNLLTQLGIELENNEKITNLEIKDKSVTLNTSLNKKFSINYNIENEISDYSIEIYEGNTMVQLKEAICINGLVDEYVTSFVEPHKDDLIEVSRKKNGITIIKSAFDENDNVISTGYANDGTKNWEIIDKRENSHVLDIYNLAQDKYMYESVEISDGAAVTIEKDGSFNVQNYNVVKYYSKLGEQISLTINGKDFTNEGWIVVENKDRTFSVTKDNIKKDYSNKGILTQVTINNKELCPNDFTITENDDGTFSVKNKDNSLIKNINQEGTMFSVQIGEKTIPLSENDIFLENEDGTYSIIIRENNYKEINTIYDKNGQKISEEKVQYNKIKNEYITINTIMTYPVIGELTSFKAIDEDGNIRYALISNSSIGKKWISSWSIDGYTLNVGGYVEGVGHNYTIFVPAFSTAVINEDNSLTVTGIYSKIKKTYSNDGVLTSVYTEDGKDVTDLYKSLDSSKMSIEKAETISNITTEGDYKIYTTSLGKEIKLLYDKDNNITSCTISNISNITIGDKEFSPIDEVTVFSDNTFALVKNKQIDFYNSDGTMMNEQETINKVIFLSGLDINIDYIELMDFVSPDKSVIFYDNEGLQWEMSIHGRSGYFNDGNINISKFKQNNTGTESVLWTYLLDSKLLNKQTIHLTIIDNIEYRTTIDEDYSTNIKTIEECDGIFTTKKTRINLTTGEIISENILSDTYMNYINKLKIINPELIKYFHVEGSVECFDLSDTVKSDIDILFKAHEKGLEASGGKQDTPEYKTAFDNYVSSQMVKNYIGSEKSLSDIAKETNVGEVIETSVGLFVNNETELKKLNMTKEQYLELFPPVLRYATKQGGTGDCYFIADLISWMNNPKTYARILQMINVDNNTGNITVTFDGLPEYTVFFENGNLKDLDREGNPNWHWNHPASCGANGAKGCLILEQAFAIVRFASEQEQEISTMDIDDAMSYIRGGGTSMCTEILFGSNITNQIRSFRTNKFLNKEKVDALEEDAISFIKSAQNYNSTFKELIDYLKTNNLIYISVYLEEPLIIDFLTDIIVWSEELLKTITDFPNIWNEFIDNNGNVDIDKFKSVVQSNYSHYLFPKTFEFLTDSQLTDIIKIMDKSPDNYEQISLNYSKQKKPLLFPINPDPLINIIRNFDDYDIEDIKTNGLYNTIQNYKKTPDLGSEQILTIGYLFNLSKKLENHEISISAGFSKDIINRNIITGHAYSVSNIDTENEIISVINPWSGGVEINLSYDEFVEFGGDMHLTTLNFEEETLP